jgi:hypothetical protein
MSRLDCTSVESAVNSLAAAAAVPSATVRGAIVEFEEPCEWGLVDVREELPRQLLAGLPGSSWPLRFEECIYFHGTRTADAARFHREGIHPLGEQREALWDFLYTLVADDVDIEAWRAFRDSIERGTGPDHGDYYRGRLDRAVSGPYAAVVRHCLLHPARIGWGDYLGRVEVVMTLGRAFFATSGIDLEARFNDATEPYVVTFRSQRITPSAVSAAFWYAYEWLRDGELSGNTDVSFRGEGSGIPAADVLGVDRMEREGDGWRFGRPTASKTTGKDTPRLRV